MWVGNHAWSLEYYVAWFVLKVINKFFLMADVPFESLFSVEDNDLSFPSHKLFCINSAKCSWHLLSNKCYNMGSNNLASPPVVHKGPIWATRSSQGSNSKIQFTSPLLKKKKWNFRLCNLNFFPKFCPKPHKFGNFQFTIKTPL